MQLSSLRLGHLAGALGILGLGVALMFWSPWSAQARADQGQRASNVLLNCEPSQQAVVRQTIVNNELNVAIQCVRPLATSINSGGPFYRWAASRGPSRPSMLRRRHLSVRRPRPEPVSFPGHPRAGGPGRNARSSSEARRAPAQA